VLEERIDDMEQKLLGKVALVTGSSRGLGRAYALRLARLGADVVVHDITLEAAAEYGEDTSGEGAAEAIRALGRRSFFEAADVRDSGAVRALVDRVVGEFGRIDILVNNAGGDIAERGGKPRPNDCVEIPEADLHAVMDRNLLGTMHCCRAVAPLMIEQRAGKIVNIASVAAYQGSGNSSIYSVAKAAILHYTRCLAAQLRPYGVNVNCIAPGAVKTARFLADRPHLTPEQLKGKGALERIGEVEDLAKVVEFFATDLSDFVSGQILRVDGGSFLSG
jgi:3-oxoacyl-[acyl-carrier protein] reductase